MQIAELKNPRIAHRKKGNAMKGIPLIKPKIVPVSTANTDLFSLWIPKQEEFAKQYLSVEVNLREMFTIPEDLPWQSSIPVFDPSGLTNRDGFELLKKLGHNPWEEADVMRYSGSEANTDPTDRKSVV